MKPFKFSVVMAAYNTEPFLAESIESLLAQDIGFQENIQLILVDDGSTDGTGRICDEYGAKYPENILVIHKENGGVAAARNEGLEHVQGDFVNFLDSDDKLSPNAMGLVASFFEAQEGEVDIVAIPLLHFDGGRGGHRLNDKFEAGTRVIDLEQEYGVVHPHTNASFLRRQALAGVRFDGRLRFCEDAKVCAEVLLKKRKLGVVSEAVYWYRKRTGGEASAIQRSESMKEWYVPTVTYYSLDIFRLAEERYGEVPRFLQFMVMYDLQWKIKKNQREIRKVLDDRETEEFLSLCDRVLAQVEDEVILGQRQIYPSHKAMLLRRKHHVPLELRPYGGDFLFCLGSHELATISGSAAKWEFLQVKGDVLCVEGYTGFPEMGTEFLEEMETWVSVNDEPPEPCEEDRRDTGRVEGSEALGERIFSAISFRFRVHCLSCYKSLSIRLYTKFRGRLIERKNVFHGFFFPVVDTYPHAYVRLGGWMAFTEGNALKLRRQSFLYQAGRELCLWRDFQKSGRNGWKRAVAYRAAYWLLQPLAPRDIWIVSDRINKADDSGEAFFRYLVEQGKAGHVWFLLHPECGDYQRMQGVGKVLSYRSRKHRLLHLLASRIISTAADAYVMDPFMPEASFYWDILKQKRQVFLQHGVTKDDQSRWLNRYKKNLAIFATAAPREQESILTGKYFYGEDVARLTGFPRYDRLENHPEKLITIMPTWRDVLGGNDTYYKDGRKRYGEDFRETGYFRFYDALLNDEGLRQAAEEAGYLLQFMPHPNILPVLHMFRQPKHVRFCSLEDSYRDIFSRSSLVVTDYSSAVFDFAYLEKPVIYCQFDKEEFFRNHLYSRGYFDYERDGFGEVEKDLEGTVARIADYMRNGCRMKEKYRERVRNFFAYHDRRNSERVYEAIRSLE